MAAAHHSAMPARRRALAASPASGFRSFLPGLLAALAVGGAVAVAAMTPVPGEPVVVPVMPWQSPSAVARLALDRGWTVVDVGRRRVVLAPRPSAVPLFPSIRADDVSCSRS